MKFELKLCPHCRVMCNFFVKDGEKLCGKCGRKEQKTKPPKIITDLLGV